MSATLPTLSQLNWSSKTSTLSQSDERSAMWKSSMPGFTAMPSRPSIRFIEPQVSEKTRTVPLRLEVPNRDGRLRSGMYATVRFHPVVAKGVIVVPSVAVLRTGERNLVVLAEGEGRFAPRQVRLGSQGDGETEVLSGLQEGEQVVTSAQFLIDSESNLREALQKMVRASGGKK